MATTLPLRPSPRLFLSRLFTCRFHASPPKLEWLDKPPKLQRLDKHPSPTTSPLTPQSTSGTIGKPNSSTRNTPARRAVSLLEDLFGQPRQPTPLRKSERRIPRIPLDTRRKLDDFGTRPLQRPRRLEGRTEERMVLQQQRAQWQERKRRFAGSGADGRAKEVNAVVSIRSAGPHLSEEDIRRIVPGGKHIEGWTTWRDEGVVKVMPERNLQTMQHTGRYLILFATVAAATAFKDTAARLHALATKHDRAVAPNAPLAPPPSPDPQDESAQLAAYALVPPPRKLDIQVLHEPFNPKLRRVVHHLGYSPVEATRRSPHEVLVAPEGAHVVSFALMTRALKNDAAARNLHWATVGPNTGVRMLDLDVQDAEGSWREFAATPFDDERPVSQRRFIVSFRDEAEARRFVAGWHRRDIRALVQDLDLESVMLNVELLW